MLRNTVDAVQNNCLCLHMRATNHGFTVRLAAVVRRLRGYDCFLIPALMLAQQPIPSVSKVAEDRWQTHSVGLPIAQGRGWSVIAEAGGGVHLRGLELQWADGRRQALTVWQAEIALGVRVGRLQ